MKPSSKRNKAEVSDEDVSQEECEIEDVDEEEESDDDAVESEEVEGNESGEEEAEDGEDEDGEDEDGEDEDGEDEDGEDEDGEDEDGEDEDGEDEDDEVEGKVDEQEGDEAEEGESEKDEDEADGEVEDEEGLAQRAQKLLEEEEDEIEREMEETKARAEKFKAEEDRKGVIYIERVPPLMQVQKLRHIFDQFGKTGRIYLTPEDNSIARRRKKMGNRKKNFVDGWVEFMDKKVARYVAEALNANTLGGKKRHNYWRDDVWSIRYLPKFKWHHLMEHRHYHNQVRKAKLTQQILQSRRETHFYTEQVERKRYREKVAKSQEQKRKRKAEREQAAPATKKSRKEASQDAMLSGLVG